jgi:hypothetical protein
MKLSLLLAAGLAALHLTAHAIGHHADLAIHDRTTGRELPVHWHEGRAYVVGRPGNEYQVTVRNRRGEDLLAVVSVDGVNVLSGESANPRQGGYILNPWQSTDIRGWRKSLSEVAAFYFTSLGDSYAARTGRPDNVGVIGVALFRRKLEPRPRADAAPFEQQPYRDEPYREKRLEKSEMLAPPSKDAMRAQSPAAAGAPLGTGHGRREESHVRWVDFERANDPVETITIYYDSYRNLVARGVLVTPPGPRNPNPFPGFVPDPV